MLYFVFFMLFMPYTSIILSVTPFGFFFSLCLEFFRFMNFLFFIFFIFLISCVFSVRSFTRYWYVLTCSRFAVVFIHYFYKFVFHFYYLSSDVFSSFVLCFKFFV